MSFFDRKLSFLLVLVALPLLFFPKINLINVDSGETAGLRVDDLVLLFLGTLIFWAHKYSQKRLYKIEGWILWITAFGLF